MLQVMASVENILEMCGKDLERCVYLNSTCLTYNE